MFEAMLTKVRGRALVPLALAAIAIVAFTLRDPLWPMQVYSGGYFNDFANQWFAGKAAPRAIPVYDLESLTAFARTWDPKAHYTNFVYPPFALFIVAPFGKLPMWLAFPAWNAVSLALFWLAARPFRPGWLLITPASLLCLTFGQYGLMIGAFWLWAWRMQPWAAALLVMKPHIGFLVAFPYLRDPRRLAFASLWALGLVATSIAFFGIDAWTSFFGQGLGRQAGLIREDGMPNWVLQAVTPLIGFGVSGWLMYGAATIVIVWRKLDVFTGATATFLLSPYGLHYDLTVVCLAFGLLLAREKLRWFETIICVAAFLSPIIVGFGTWFIPPILLLGLWVQCRHPALNWAGDIPYLDPFRRQHPADESLQNERSSELD